ncbi:hypothetical protein TNCV_309181 [Trichonephila clavipes]|nr:hypothetical protein TNCV_309181 [Trichonephila clavipes]
MKGNSQLTHDKISIIDRVIAAQRACTLQWISALVEIFANEQADNLAKLAPNSPQHSNKLTFTDADAISRRPLTFPSS